MTPVLAHPDPGPEESCPCAEPLELQLANARAEGARRERLATQKLLAFLMLIVTAETLGILIALLSWWLP
jgi:hypothetical protein